MDDGGMINEIRNAFGGVDVSWVSKFSNEQESLYSVGEGFTVESVDTVGDVQTIVLSKGIEEKYWHW